MIDVLLTTWPNCCERLDYLPRTLTALRQRLSCTGRELHYTVVSESQGVSEEHSNRLDTICKAFDSRLVWHTARANLGANLNFAYSQCQSDLRFYYQDDWELTRPLDLAVDSTALESHTDWAMVRYYVKHARCDSGTPWAEVDLTSNWPYGDNPLLAHRRWLEKAGRFFEGGDAAKHELGMISQLRKSGLRISAPRAVADDGSFYFRHIGEVSAFTEKR